MRWAAVAAESFLAAATAYHAAAAAAVPTAITVETVATSTNMRDLPLTPSELSTLQLLCKCLQQTTPPELRSQETQKGHDGEGGGRLVEAAATTGVGQQQPPSLYCALSPSELEHHQELASALRAQLDALQRATTTGTNETEKEQVDEVCPLCAAPVPWSCYHPALNGSSSSNGSTRKRMLPWGYGMCTGGHLLDRCARRLTLLNPFEAEDDDTDDDVDEEEEEEDGRDENEMRDGRYDEGADGSNSHSRVDSGHQGAIASATAPQPLLRPEQWRCGACQRSTLAAPLSVASALQLGSSANMRSSHSAPYTADSSPSSSWTPFAWLSTAAGVFTDRNSSSRNSVSEPGNTLTNAAAERTCLLCSTACTRAPM